MRNWGAVLVVLALAGCSAEPAPPPAPPSATSAAPTPADLDKRVKAALAPPGAFDSLGGRFSRDSPENEADPAFDKEPVTTVCTDTPMPIDTGISAARIRSWGGGVQLTEMVHATSDLPGSVMLSTVQRWSRLCTTYSPEGVSNRTPVPDVPLAKPAGVDEAYSYCENTDFVLSPVHCHVVLARGNLLATISAMGPNQDVVMERLRSALPIFVEPFVKA